ncbi:MAG: hypothetical protein M3282_08140 [Gemmatimonadota bacterium]|nr:hypothetical protein [Gemmatimonadota bacterium]
MSPVLVNESPAVSVRVPAANGGVPRAVPVAVAAPPPPAQRGAFGVLRVSVAGFVTYGLMVGTLIAAKLYFLDHPADFPLEAQASAFEWRLLLTLASCGLFGLLLAPYARFPDMWDRAVQHRKRLLVPIVWGVLYGLVTVVRDLPNPSGEHLYYPASIPFYAFGAVFLEILLRLFGVTLITWLVGEVFLMGHLRNAAFWVANVLTSLYEPLPHVWDDLQRVEQPVQVPVTLVNWAFHPMFLSNLLTGYLYRRFGFLSAVLFRLSFYAVWHVGYGNFWRFQPFPWG